MFFNSHDALVPQDGNGTWDVYEYEPEGYENEAGVQQCTSGTSTFGPRSQGCVGLISSGSSGQESGFLDASETGGDVFFLTTAQLSSQDYDDAYDVYDAHECTSLSPCVSPPVVQPPECDTEASCKPSPEPQPGIYGAPASATFTGPGDLMPPLVAVTPKPKKAVRKSVRCRKGFVKNRKGRCVKRRQAKKAHKANRERKH